MMFLRLKQFDDVPGSCKNPSTNENKRRLRVLARAGTLLHLSLLQLSRQRFR